MDLAVLKFHATDVPFLKLGKSTSAVERQKVIVIGNPTGLMGTVSDGIISAFRENHSMIQVTAPISHGSSGSPVMDETGQIIGVATLVIAEGQNLNFAIPVEKVPAGLVQLPSEQLVASAQPTATPTPEPTGTFTPWPEPTRATLMSPDDYAAVSTNQKIKEWYALHPNTPLTAGKVWEWYDKAKEWYADKVKEWYALHPNTPLTAEMVWEWYDKAHQHPKRNFTKLEQTK